jgi:transcriptional regulator with GAF, ATPase, and Fis domain
MRTQIEERQKQNGPVALIGESKRIQSIRHAIHKISGLKNQPTVVLISGETGVGKDVVARLIHQKRGNGHAYVPLNCSAMPQDLLENELFGHVKGGFTGATEKKEGLFHHSQDGTLFMDEIGEMPLSLQAKLLRVLEDRKFRRVGATHEEQISARHIVFATNQDLKQRVDQKQFREDLFFRINQHEIVVPPLRDRPEDIPCLIEYFCRSHPDSMPLEFGPEAINLLLRYPWPGNVRELRTVVQRCLVEFHTNKIDANDLCRIYESFSLIADLPTCSHTGNRDKNGSCWEIVSTPGSMVSQNKLKECIHCKTFHYYLQFHIKKLPPGNFISFLLRNFQTFLDVSSSNEMKKMESQSYKEFLWEAQHHYFECLIQNFQHDTTKISEKAEITQRQVQNILKKHRL